MARFKIISGYLPPFAGKNTNPRMVVHDPETGMFLRHSKGPRQGHGWDTYGDDYITVDLAIQALREAPPPFRVEHFRPRKHWKVDGKCTQEHIDEAEAAYQTPAPYRSAE